MEEWSQTAVSFIWGFARSPLFQEWYRQALPDRDTMVFGPSKHWISIELLTKMQPSQSNFLPTKESPSSWLFLRALFLAATSSLSLFCEKDVSAKDYLLTIGGGYEPAGNQASLEANVLFFQQVVSEQFPTTVDHQIFFADGFDTQEDLQVMSPKEEANSPTIALLESAFAIDRPSLSYRNHQVPNIGGPISPKSVRAALDGIATKLTDGDRLFIYVTAHGAPGSSKDPMNTSITCWRKQPLSMKTFSEWLDRLPSGVPVVLVMAQCYCGGFANTMFEGGEPSKGLAKAVRVGFFAQRFDLPAAGCRPDIENDEEYSSYFWGAFLGRSRTGKKAEGVDGDQNGRISLEEAHAYAVRASQTIDIPLRSSDMFLRHYSRIAGYGSTRIQGGPADEALPDEELGLAHFSGRLNDVCLLGSVGQRLTIEALATQLGLPLDCEIKKVFQRNKAQSEIHQQSRVAPGRRGPGGPGGAGRRVSRNSGRRDFQKEIVESWPDLENPSDWKELPWLVGKEGESIFDELRQLPSFEAFRKSQDDRRLSKENATTAELRDVQFRRLVHTMESIVLAQNLPRIASPDIQRRFREIVALESSFLLPSPYQSP